MSEISGIKLKTLEIPIHETLGQYQTLSNGLEFDLDHAPKLELTPDKPNSARSTTKVKYLGEEIGDLYVIAFDEGDGTGDLKTYSLDDLRVATGYPRAAKVVPRGKSGTREEAELAIASQDTDNVHADPQKFAGTFDLLGLDGHLIKKIGELGHPADLETSELTPITTLTVGYRSGTDERFGDPHAVYNPNRALQVAGFLAIRDEVYQKHPEILAGLQPQEPRQP